jgi:hypothetical protein
MDDANPKQAEYMAEVCRFLNSQDYVGKVDFERFKASKNVTDLGITSLGVIALTASYLKTRGLSAAAFDPQWVSRLGEVAGLVSVFSEIDSLAGRANVPLTKATTA